MYKRPHKKQSAMANKFDLMGSIISKDKKLCSTDVLYVASIIDAVKLNPRHDVEREKLSGSAQFNCGGCNE